MGHWGGCLGSKYSCFGKIGLAGIFIMSSLVPLICLKLSFLSYGVFLATGLPEVLMSTVDFSVNPVKPLGARRGSLSWSVLLVWRCSFLWGLNGLESALTISGLSLLKSSPITSWICPLSELPAAAESRFSFSPFSLTWASVPPIWSYFKILRKGLLYPSWFDCRRSCRLDRFWAICRFYIVLSSPTV